MAAAPQQARAYGAELSTTSYGAAELWLLLEPVAAAQS